ncbi:MAG: hypothetical protein WAU75_04245 [Solirubrobacteraceae bacterium]
MREVLVSMPAGAGVVRAEYGLLVTHDVNTDGGGAYLRDEDRFAPAKSWVDEDRSVVGGLLPPGAVSVEAIDDRGRRVPAQIGGGAYVAVIDQPHDGYEAIVCCRDACGRPVRRPWAADYPSVRVTDAQESCPACGALDWDEYTPWEQWRGGRGSKVDGTHVASPIVSCRVCGHEEREGSFFAMSSTAPAAETDAEREARLARERAELRKQRWLSDSLTLRAADFPIYAVEGWPARLAGSGSDGDLLTQITVEHFDAADAKPLQGDTTSMAVMTSRRPHRPAALESARDALERWVSRDTHSDRWPEASQAAITLFLRARARQSRGAVLAAQRSEPEMIIDGAPRTVLMLTVPGGPWAAAVRHADLDITVSGRGDDPLSLRLEPIGNPGATLLGPEPPDA